MPRRRRSSGRSSSAAAAPASRHRRIGRTCPVWAVDTSVGTVGTDVHEPTLEVAARIRRHPYVRLALNSSFSALWAGQLISLFGDRVHQIALAFLVLAVTGSPVAVAFVFVAATLPNLFLVPIAGTYVDRWDQKEVMVVSDLLRAAIILLIPIAAVTNILLVYPLVFAITSVSIFFRPARVAVLPRIVREDELLTANSAMWIGETMADVIGYPLAGVFVGFLGSALPLAFWLDAATYAASAVLIATIVTSRRLRERRRRARGRATERSSPTSKAGYTLPAPRDGPAREHAPGDGRPVHGRRADRADAVLRGRDRDGPRGDAARPRTASSRRRSASATSIGGFVIGFIGDAPRPRKDGDPRLHGLGHVHRLLALTGNLAVALGLMFGSGVANMVFVIPSQTMFQERTPAGDARPRDRLPVLAGVRVDDDRDGGQRAAGADRRRRRRSWRSSGS